MKLKFYLRGIGLGIIVAAAICMCATTNNKKTEMTDEQVRARAEELGMIDSKTTLSDTSNSDVDVTVVDSPDEGEFVEVEPEEIDYLSTENVSEDESAEDIEAEVVNHEFEAEAEEPEGALADAVDADKKEETSEGEEVASPAESEDETKEEQTVSSGEIIQIVVEKGNGSDTVARKLADAGLVPNALEYDKYLMANGYDRRIAAGTHKIPKGASNEEIAKLLVSKQD